MTIRRASRAAPPPASEDLFAVFGFAWALATLFHFEFHYLIHDQALWSPRVTAALAGAAAFLLLVRPGDPRRLALLAVAQLVDVVGLLPEVPNHWLLVALVNSTWLAAVARAWRREGRFPRAGGALLAEVRAPLLVGVVLFYVWTGFWKLNSDFFRPEVSCPVGSWNNLLGQFRWLPRTPALGHAVIWVTLLVELLGPLLLLFRRTRRAGVVLFVVFHLLLGLDLAKRYVNFSTVMFALLLLYLPPAAPGRVRDRLPRLAGGVVRVAGPAAAAAYAALLAAMLLGGAKTPVYLLGRWALGLVYAGFLLSAVVLAAAITPAEPAGGVQRGVGWLFPLLVVMNGLAPIVGLKNRTSWQMYSNLRLEADVSNHFLVPRSLDLFGALSDRVVVEQATVPELEALTRRGLALPWIEFRRVLATHPEASVTYERAGTRASVTRVADVPALRPPPLPVRKLMFFRPLGARVAEECVW